jgi:hypothetical protein
MPASPFTIECRAIAARMAAITQTGGNIQSQRRLVFEDAPNIDHLRFLVQGETPAAPLVAALVLAHARTSKIIECEGVIALHSLLVASAADVIAGADFVDALPAPPVMVGTIQSANSAVDPLVMLAAGDRPLNAAVVDGVTVKIEGGAWPSIADQAFTVTVANRPLAQFNLVGADTTLEVTGGAAGATVWLEP